MFELPWHFSVVDPGSAKSAVLGETRQQAGCQWGRAVSIHDVAPHSFSITYTKALINDWPA